MYLVDTNIFLEILLKQDKSNYCKSFLEKNIAALHISDFTLHSIGVILFKQNEVQLFLKFISDTLPNVDLISLPKSKYDELIKVKSKFDLDFDDAYQFGLCQHFNLKLVTMDRDFKKTKNIEIEFL